ncbi:MAG: DUF4118 domain-containing protein [Bacteroidales bacterium]|jgi:two-component system sensor histidine kinase KdpD|nr:DUF4118 domain-containing protein [Bacteroidales bacterium]
MATTHVNIDHDWEQTVKEGKLKIFFGIMPGVGKTSAMLQAAQAEAANGKQVVISAVTWQTCPETMALMEKLEVVPPKNINYVGVSYKEMDTEAVLKRHPDIVLITDPAHTNAPGSRHLKRYHDIRELLHNGIDVYVTLNVVQLESYTDFFYEITGHMMPTVPDEFFGQADDVELIDIDPEKLVKRQREGKISSTGLLEQELETIYQKEKIEAIRKRFFQMTLDRENWQKQHANWPSKIRSRVLVLIGPDTITPQVIRRSKALSVAIDTDWIALYVETDRTLTESEKSLLENNIKLARQLGGTLITYVSNDPVEALIEVSRRERISYIILGKTRRGQIVGHHEHSFLKRLLRYSGHINVSVTCGETDDFNEKKRLFHIDRPVPGIGTKTLTVIAAMITGLLCTALNNKVDNDAPPFIVILLLFMMSALVRSSSMLVVMVIIVLACFVLAIPPLFAFPFNFPSDISMLLMFGFIALINGFLTLRIRTQDRETFRREKQSNALFLLTKRLSEATSIKDMVDTSTENLLKYFDVQVFFIFLDEDHQLTNFKYLPKGVTLTEQELEAVIWSFNQNKPTGRFTGIMSSGKYAYYPLIGKGRKIGVLVTKPEKPFGAKDYISWDAFLAQIAQSFEHQYLEMSARQTNLLNESEKLYKTIFNSISHELRIPISTIMAASDVLLTAKHSEHVRDELYVEILEATKRLNRLVENLLNMSRLESGRISAHPDWCDIHDLFNRVAENLEEELRHFNFEIIVPESMPLVRIDYGLMEQAINNLVYNATVYAPHETPICLSTCYENGFLIIQVADRGPGIDPETLTHVFNKFWRPQGEKSGGIGLGLSIVKGFVEAHNGTVFVANRKKGGVRFTIMILTERSDYYANKGNTGDEVTADM